MFCISRFQNKTICSLDRYKGVNVSQFFEGVFKSIINFTLHFNGTFQYLNLVLLLAFIVAGNSLSPILKLLGISLYQVL